MINMRYLIVSLAAVFLALGIGIFIGFMFDGQDIFLGQQEVLVEQLEYKFGEIRAENEGLQDTIDLQKKQLNYYEDFNNKIFPELINNKLQNTNIAIIETNDDYIYNGITSSIEKAKGEISSITYIKKEFLLEDSEKLEEVFSYFSEQKGSIINKNYFISFLSEELGRALLEGDEETLKYLKKQGMIELKGSYTGNIDYFVIAGGSASEESKKVQDIDLPLINKIKQYNIPIIGVEQSNVKHSYIDAYKKEKISTVDNVDTMIGQYSMIEVMQGKDGNYGIKPSAEQLIP